MISIITCQVILYADRVLFFPVDVGTSFSENAVRESLLGCIKDVQFRMSRLYCQKRQIKLEFIQVVLEHLLPRSTRE